MDEHTPSRSWPRRPPSFRSHDARRRIRAWRESFTELIASLPGNVREICQYGFTEMFNNAVDHSGGTELTARLELTDATVSLWILDDGIGIFRKIKEGLNLPNERQAIEELAKGKVTTDPKNHTGEGIFFTSRMFDRFSLISGRLFFDHRASGNNWLIEDEPSETQGTAVRMSIATRSARTRQQVFKQHTSAGDGPTFDKTHFAVRLLRVGTENLVSRSQAKRLLAGFQGFNEIVLDFDGVKEIGQAFADEIFRVFRNQNPGIRIVWNRANKHVEQMIRQVQAGTESNPRA